jgi:hypothetical protein
VSVQQIQVNRWRNAVVMKLDWATQQLESETQVDKCARLIDLIANGARALSNLDTIRIV